MVLQRVSTRYETNFHEMRIHGVPPTFKVWIRWKPYEHPT
jgi:hypothetical protein